MLLSHIAVEKIIQSDYSYIFYTIVETLINIAKAMLVISGFAGLLRIIIKVYNPKCKALEVLKKIYDLFCPDLF